MFVDLVVDSMRQLFPEEYADRTWDNVGLLVGSLPESESSLETPRTVLLTTDLTPDVVDEALECRAQVIVTYHPIIFKGIKALDPENSQHRSLLRLIQAGVAVYSPHTALDAQYGGINDWLVEIVLSVARAQDCTAKHTSVIRPLTGAAAVRAAAEQQAREQRGMKQLHLGPDVGMGRVIQFQKAVSAEELIRGVAAQLSGSSGASGVSRGLRHVLVARPRDKRVKAGPSVVSSVAVCAGSGYDILAQAPDRVDMYITGEVSHHAALEATTRGIWVVSVLHSNSERRFLQERLQPLLKYRLDHHELNGYDNVNVVVSERDRDPFTVWDLTEEAPWLV